MPLLPPMVQREGVIITPIQPSMLMYVNLYSKDKGADQKFLYNYANVNMIPEIKRIKGIARADYMEILLTQRDALESRFELTETRMQQLHAWVNTYKALGGGWN